ncbi:MAG: low affinity iron permease family protein [Myxococcota bacterium]
MIGQNGNGSTTKRVPAVFRSLSSKASEAVGSPWAFVIALLIVVGWALLGPVCHYSDTWQLVINTGTTIVTFLMVFLLQHTQNRDTLALRLKVDELIRAMAGARNALLDAEDLDDETLMALQKEYRAQAAKARERLERRQAK